ncbi:hypothetical protein AV521_12395 [Streptomyces sp. IMTB 2501]|uniref:DUF6234 family protein n=1 Tax=Streptomyces sp. IMTB 2501 TaxID=1776340 RepID=UPI00096D6C9D|nr:DUF6234 family protein [Streptomyces sp. IMTB 2501]OLZ70811.1 hypothetical protein AV521_12395 [Streptomyces sp. IMTB 2501]
MSDHAPSRRTTGEDVFFAVLLWVLDAIVGIVVLLTALGSTGFNMFEPDRHADMTPVFSYVAGFAGVVLLSAIGLYRGGYRVSVGAQVLAATATLAFCTAGFSGHLTL